MSLLGLNSAEGQVWDSMISRADILPGYEIEKAFGVIEGLSEHSFPVVGIGGVGFHQGGELDKLLYEAKEQMSRKAFALGANAIIGFRYAVMGREIEKSVLAYGTAVKCRKSSAI